MTDILLINPNTTRSITNLVLKTARTFAGKPVASQIAVAFRRALPSNVSASSTTSGMPAGQHPR